MWMWQSIWVWLGVLDRVWVQNCLSISKTLILLNLVAIDIWTWLALIEIDRKARRVRAEIALPAAQTKDLLKKKHKQESKSECE